VSREEQPRGAHRPALIVAGNVSVDVVMGPIEAWPTPGTETLAERLEWRVGGQLGNAAQALHGLGVPATLVWDVGDDAMGGWLARELAPCGDPPRTLHAATSVTVGVTHPDGERTFLSHLGHLAQSDPEGLARAIDAAAPGDHLLVLGTFLLPRWRPALPGLLGRARARGLVTALDTGWPSEGWSETVRAELREALAHVDVFLPNLAEASGLLGLDGASPERVAEALLPLLPGAVVLKLGADGVLAAGDGERERVAAPVVTVRETVGAGDTFDAALLAARLRGSTWRDALEAAVGVASHAVSTWPRRYPDWRAAGGSGGGGPRGAAAAPG
jgi:ribokinase